MPPVRGLLPPCFISGLYTEPPSTAATGALQPPVPAPAPAVAHHCLPRASQRARAPGWLCQLSAPQHGRRDPVGSPGEGFSAG